MELGEGACRPSQLIPSNQENIKACYQISPSLILSLPKHGETMMEPLLNEVKVDPEAQGVALHVGLT
ncbi:unnamed protein product [Citrullus colocynthis]|uniref:Uncharacterized protein n=1 Tax=Citrullus colocynthis TaxID=252529 RepID=A0ABP0ZCX9_9ROSI